MRKRALCVLFVMSLMNPDPHNSFAAEDGRAAERRRMIDTQIAGRGITDPRVLDALRRVPRDAFVPAYLGREAYADKPLPIGHDQTISQPYIVALMTASARIAAEDKVLEIGTGSGYQAAVLALLARQVFSVEIIAPLAKSAAARLKKLGYTNVTIREGDGYAGWPEEAPFDAIIVTAAPPSVPQELIRQLKPGGRLVVPVGTLFQELLLITKEEDGAVREEQLIPVRFVPMVRRKNDDTD
ncbi:MAG: protein-L-isoaspartate(D-aspartate) O-methyltransferase [Deltaproteobacteria bacterium]